MNHSASGSFLGTFYHQAEERGYQFPGAGSYELDKSTVSRPATSCTKPCTMSRRPKISCPSMGAARMTASLCGADQLLLEPGPEFGPAPRSDFDDASNNRGYCTAAFSSQSKRFTTPHQVRRRQSVARSVRWLGGWLAGWWLDVFDPFGIALASPHESKLLCVLWSLSSSPFAHRFMEGTNGANLSANYHAKVCR